MYVIALNITVRFVMYKQYVYHHQINLCYHSCLIINL